MSTIYKELFLKFFFKKFQKQFFVFAALAANYFGNSPLFFLIAHLALSGMIHSLGSFKIDHRLGSEVED